MIEIEIKRRAGKTTGEFSYDLEVLARSFFPEKSFQSIVRKEWESEDGYPIVCRLDGREILSERFAPGYTRNEVKRALFHALTSESGRVLQWGILTGVRPTKIPMQLRASGSGREEIEDILRREYLLRDDKAWLATDVALREYELMKPFDHKNGYNIYVGIPFCPSICRYCSFSSYDYGRYENRVDEYLDALEKELAYAGGRFSGHKLHSIYVGGGTPTSPDERRFARLMDMLHRYLPVGQAAEFTVEAGRPDSINEEKLKIMKEAGVSRISINPQTMKQRTLDILGRRHTAEQVREVYKQARSCGFDNINMDLIVGLPEEDEVDFSNTMNYILDMEPDSITVHTLVIKRASRMRREQMEGGGDIRSEDTLVPVLQRASGEYMRENGYRPYYMYRQKNKAGTTKNTNQENVGYAKPGKECLYNIFMMEELENIVALGSGGSSKHVFPDENRMERVENVKSVEQYIDRIDEMIDRKKAEWRTL